MKNRLILTASVLVLSSVSSVAQEAFEQPSVASDSGFYASVFGGAALFEDGTIRTDLGKADVEIDTGYSAGLRVGYDFGSFRIEGEFSYLKGDVDEIDEIRVNSDIEVAGAMVNVLWDFDLSPVTVSVGVGVGAMQAQFGKMVDVGGNTLVTESKDTAFAYQGIASASYLLTENASFGLNYRYLATSDMDNSAKLPLSGQSVDYDGLGISLVEVFFSYNF